MTDSMSEVVERLSRVLAKREAFRHVPTMTDEQARRHIDARWRHLAPDIVAALTELSAMGLVVVPREPTEEMLEAGRLHVIDPNRNRLNCAWRLMLTASPKVQP